MRICTSHGAATIGETALLVSKVAARFVRPRCLVYCLPIPAPLNGATARLMRRGAAYKAPPHG
nr:MAG TPA: hypothetical protein [Caudoviricetes sp.]